MITKCRFCDYQREKQLSTAILYLMQDAPQEDCLLWMQRLIQDNGTAEYNSVKIHMGIKHKDKTYKHISPIHILDDTERSYVDGFCSPEAVIEHNS